MGRIKLYTAALLLIAAFLATAVWSYYAIYTLGDVSIYKENGLLENGQALLVLLAGLIFLIPPFTHRKSSRLIYIFFTYLCVAFFLREVDVEKLQLPQILIILGSGKGRNLLLAIALLAIAIPAFRERHLYRKAALKFLLSPAGFLMMAAGVALIISDIIERSSHTTVFSEELVELFAYLLMLLSALFTLERNPKRDQHR